MTAFQKTAAAVFCIVVGIAIYEMCETSRARSEIEALNRQRAPFDEQVRRLQRERDELAARLLAAQDEKERLKNNSVELLKLREAVPLLRKEASLQAATPSEIEKQSWMKKVEKLKQFLAKNPKANIPEMAYLKDANWILITAQDLETERDYLSALGDLERYGVYAFLSEVGIALQGYSVANGNQFPTDVLQLKPYFKSPVNDAILQRYAIFPSKQFGVYGTFVGNDWVIGQNDRYTNTAGRQFREGVTLSPSGQAEIRHLEGMKL